MMETRNPSRVPAVDRALDVIEFVVSREAEVSLSEILENLDIPRQTLIRILNTLCDRGFLNKSSKRGSYRIGLKFLYLGHRLLGKFDIRNAAWDSMKQLSLETRKTIELSTLDHDQLILLEQIPSSEGISLHSRVGSVFPFFHAVSVGKVYLSLMDRAKRRRVLDKIGLPAVTPRTITDREALEREIEEVRKRGYAFEDQELREGVRRIAAPVFDGAGNHVGCIGISATIFSFELHDVERYGTLLMETAQKIRDRIAKSQGGV